MSDQSKKLWLVTDEELLTSDRNLAYVTPRPRCDPCNVFLRMINCSQCKKKQTKKTKKNS